MRLGENPTARERAVTLLGSEELEERIAGIGWAILSAADQVVGALKDPEIDWDHALKVAEFHEQRDEGGDG